MWTNCGPTMFHSLLHTTPKANNSVPRFIVCVCSHMSYTLYHTCFIPISHAFASVPAFHAALGADGTTPQSIVSHLSYI